MKKIIKFLTALLLILLVKKVKAIELNYSEWKSEYPKGVSEILIESEVRYKWYKEKINDIEYLIKENIGEKQVDYNDYKYETFESLDNQSEYEERSVSKEYKNYTFKSNDITNAIISNMNFYDEVYFYEIEVKIVNTNEIIEYKTEEKYKFLYDKDYKNGFKVNSPEKILISFDNSYNIKDLELKIYYRCKGNNYNNFSFSFSTRKNYSLYIKSTRLGVCDNDSCILSYDYNNLNEQLSFYIPVYTYTDKLYKTYNVEKEYDEEYHAFLDGFIKDEESKKTFYRYILNDYIYLNGDGNVVKDERNCIKGICLLYYIVNEEPENVIIPQTSDDINIAFIEIIVSIISIVLILWIYIIKKRKKNVERINNLVLSKTFKND